MIPTTRDDATIALKSCAQAQGDRFDGTAFAIAAAIHENPDRDVSQALDVLTHLTQQTKQSAPEDAEGFARLL
jgi:hypothetical protein